MQATQTSAGVDLQLSSLGASECSSSPPVHPLPDTEIDRLYECFKHHLESNHAPGVSADEMEAIVQESNQAV